tara:strand:+ start:17412 stop:17525 length:114 start_codon:yes stop_codon:yes gene_type:complete
MNENNKNNNPKKVILFGDISNLIKREESGKLKYLKIL